MKKILIFSVIISGLLATTINIPSDYTTIQEGIDASVDGDTVLIAQGTYNENLILEKEIVLTSHAIYDDLDSDWLNNLIIQETIISGAQEANDSNKGSCLVIRGSGWGYSGNPRPEIIGLTFQDGTGTNMRIYNCGVIQRERSGGGILIYNAYPIIMYNRFLNNGFSNDAGGYNPTNIETSSGGAIGHYGSEDVEFDEDRSFARRNNNQNNNLAPTYVNDNPVTADAYNNKMNYPNNDLGPKGIADVGYVPGVRGNNDFVPGVRGDLIIYMYDSYGDGWNGNELTIGEHTFTIENGNYGTATLTLDDGTYMVTCGGGTWQEEVSWQIVDAADGTEILAGGAPYEGGFVMGGTPPQDVPDTLFIQNNYFEGNSSGDGENFYSFGYEGSIDVSHSVFEDIDCETNSVNDFVLRSIENEADYVQNEISGNCIELNSFYVSNSGDDNNAGTLSEPLKTIGHALTLVRDGETVTTINLASGVYSPSTNGEIFPIVLPDKIHLIGDASETTILDAEASVFKEAAVMIIKEVQDVRVANLTLTGGFSEGHGCTGGGGLLITANDMFNNDGFNSAWTHAVIENVIIEDNWSHNGGGLSLFRSNGSVLNNVIIRNNACSAFGGGVFTYGSTVNMTNVTVTGNNNLAGTAQGGGMMMPITGGTLDNMTITDNEGCCGGGGVWTNGNNCTWVMTNSIISGNSSDWGGGLAMLGGDVNGAQPTLINVTISNNIATGTGGAVWVVSASPTFENCTFTGNTSYNEAMGGTFWLMGSDVTGAGITLTDCLIRDNTVPYATAGIWAMDITALNLTRVTIADNSGAYNPGVFISDAFDNGDFTPATLTNCTITGNSSDNGGALRATYGGHFNVTNSIIWDNSTPEQVSLENGTVNITYSDIDGGFNGEGNINADPLFTNADNGDFTLSQSSSPCFDAGTADIDGDGFQDITDYFGTAPDMGAFEFCEGGTYIDDCGTCDGDNSVCTGCTDPQALNFDAENIFADESCLYTIEQDIWVSTSGDDSLNTGLDADSPFKTITNALWRIAQSMTPYTIHLSEGVYSRSATGESFPIILKSYVNISGSGEGVTIIDAEEMSRVMNIIGNESIIISDMTLTGGFANDLTSGLTGGGILAEFSNFTLDNVTISGNIAEDYGGGIYMEESSPTLTNLTISDNMSNDDGGGMYLKYSDPTMTDVIISGNTSNDHAGGIQLLYSNPTMTNVAISDNTADDDGGGMYLRYSNPIMTNVTISGNTANDDSGCMYLNRSSPTLKNSIIWNNAPPSITISGDETPIISYSDIEGGWEGEGNIDTDPLFCNPGSGDYRLDEESPCIATGENGENMGALGVGCELILSTDKDVLPSQFVLYQNYPNPFNPVTTLRYDLPEDAMVNITIYDMMGRQVSTLVSSHHSAGYKSVQWNATNDKGAPVSAGVYLYMIQAGEFRQMRKMILLK